MTLENAEHVPDASTLAADVCVIGSGAAGITLARQLDGARSQVIVLEAGGLERDLAVEEEAFAIDHAGVPYRNPCPTRGRYFGGSTNLWFGRIAMLDPIDFEDRAWVPHSGWPIAYEELDPWLAQAARILDIPNFQRIRPGNWKGYPAADLLTNQAGANIGVFLWANGLYMAPHNRHVIEASRNVRLLFNAATTELIPKESSKAIDHIIARTPSGHVLKVKASIYVLAAGGLENPRLLLASTRNSPHGIANEHDVVGRYYMDHPRTQSLATVDIRHVSSKQLESLSLLGEHTSRQHGRFQFRITFPETMQRNEQLLNHSMHADFASDVHSQEGYSAARRLLNRLRGKHVDTIGRQITTDLAGDLRSALHDAPALLKHSVHVLRRTARPTRMFLNDQMEQEPDPSSRVTVNPSIRDRWGLPKSKLDWRIGESTYRSQRRMHVFVKEILERAGISNFTSKLLDGADPEGTVMEMKHPSGTTRMSHSPTTGVVDADSRVHGVDNLYVAGTSVFPTGGHANPTLLIVALAARLADHLRQRVPVV